MKEKRWNSLNLLLGPAQLKVSHSHKREGSHLKKAFDFLKSTGIDAKGKKLLDMGCGKNTLKDSVLSEWHGLDIYNFDFDNYHRCDAHETSFEDGYFDIVFCSHLLEHVLAPLIVLFEINRILSDDGRAVIAVPTYPNFKTPEHLTLITADCWAWMIESTGLKTIKRKDWGGSVGFLCKKNRPIRSETEEKIERIYWRKNEKEAKD